MDRSGKNPAQASPIHPSSISPRRRRGDRNPAAREVGPRGVARPDLRSDSWPDSEWFSWACSLVRPHRSGCPFPSPHLKGAEIGDSGTCPRPRFEGCARRPLQAKRQLRRTYSGRSARVATRPESQAALPRTPYSIFRSDCRLPAAVRRLRPADSERFLPASLWLARLETR